MRKLAKTAKIVMALCLTCFIFPARAVKAEEEAVMIPYTSVTSFGTTTAVLDDQSYNTYYIYEEGETLTITAEEDVYGIYIEWYAIPSPWSLSPLGQTDILCGQNGYLHEYIALDTPAREFTLTMEAGEAITGIELYSRGALPDDVQVWNPPCEKADILVFSTHADDEVLFLGGAIATYAGQEGLRTQVVYLSTYWQAASGGGVQREHEKLDGLWALGVSSYPVNSGMLDYYAESLEQAEQYYDEEAVTSWATEMIRRFTPQIVITQDFNGEYGHGGHMLLAKCVADALEASNDANLYPDSAALYGVHDTAKAYFHLYEENQIILDLETPLSRFDGLTAVEVAKNAYLKHVSQQAWWFYVSNDPDDPKADQINCSVFGLYRTTVGPDENNDMTEHIISYDDQEKAAAEAAAEEAEKKREEELALAEKTAALKRKRAFIGAGLVGSIVLLTALVVFLIFKGGRKRS